MKTRPAGALWILLPLLFLITGCATNAPPPQGAFVVESPPAADSVLQIQQRIVDSIAHARAAVVSVVARNVTPIYATGKEREKKITRVDGTGFVADPSGYLYTCAHVVHEASEVKVRLSTGEEVEAEIVGADPGTDIALLRIPTEKPLPVLQLADSHQVQPGQFVIALGNPFSLELTATFGIVSATRRNLQEIAGYSRRSADSLIRYEDYIQTDAWINRGSSGGPLLDLDGKVVGMNSMIRAAREGISSGPGFAVPADMLERVGRTLREHGYVARGWLGVGLQSHEKGVRLFRVLTGAPADKAGLRTGDILLKFADKQIPNRAWLQQEIANTRVGTVVPFTVLRANRTEVVNVTIGEMPEEYSGRRRPVAAGDAPSNPNVEN